MPEDIGAGSQPPSELRGLTPEQNQEAIQLRQKSIQSAEELEKSRKEFVQLSEQRAEFYNAANLVFNKFIYSPDSSVTEEEKKAANLVYHRLYDLARQEDDKRLQPQVKFYNDMSQDIHDKSKSQEHFLKHEEGYKEQAIIEARNDGKEINYPPYTDTKETAQKKAEALEAAANASELRAQRQQLGHEINFGNLNDAQRTEAQAEHDRLSNELTQAADRSSRLGHEVGLQELNDKGMGDAILPPEGDAEPYKHAGKTPEEFMAKKREEQETLRSEIADKERQTFGDLQNALTDEQAEEFHAPLGRQIRGEKPMSLEELQALRATLTQQQIEQFGEFLDKKIEDLKYEKEKAENIASGVSRTIGGPEGVSSNEHFPSVIDIAHEPISPIDGPLPSESRPFPPDDHIEDDEDDEDR